MVYLKLLFQVSIKFSPLLRRDAKVLEGQRGGVPQVRKIVYTLIYDT